MSATDSTMNGGSKTDKTSQPTGSKRRSGSRSRSKSRSRSRSESTKRSRSRSRSRRKYDSDSRSRSRERGRKYDSRSRSRSRSYERPRRSRAPPSFNRGRGEPRHLRRMRDVSRDNPPDSNVLGVFGLSQRTTRDDLEDIFGRYGRIEKVEMIVDHFTGQSRGFGFVYFASTDDASDARDACNGMEVDGRNIRTDYSITKRAHSPTPGTYRGRRSDYGRGRDEFEGGEGGGRDGGGRGRDGGGRDGGGRDGGGRDGGGRDGGGRDRYRDRGDRYREDYRRRPGRGR